MQAGNNNYRKLVMLIKTLHSTPAVMEWRRLGVIGREEEEEEEDSLGQISNETLFTSSSSDAQTAAAAAFCTYFNFHHEYIDTGLHSAHRHSLFNV